MRIPAQALSWCQRVSRLSGIKQILLLTLSIFCHWICQAVEMPAHTTWTTYTTEKGWSEGELVCEMSGGYLANINTSHKTDVFRQLLGKEPLASAIKRGTSVGLHNVDNANSDPRVWLPDGDVNTVSYSYSTFSSGGCVSIGETRTWSIGCSISNEFSCERHWGYVCPYEVLSGSKAVSSVGYTQVGTPSDQECQTRCDELGIGCWAAAWEQAPAGLCRLYQETSPFFFDDAAKIESDPGFTLLIKRCYESLKNDNPNSGIVLPSLRPFSTLLSQDSGGRLYTLVKERRTWNSARALCSSIGQTLAGSTSALDYTVIHQIILEYYETTHNVIARNPHWVDFTGDLNGVAKWGDDGSGLSGSVTVLGNDVTQCGSLDVDSGQAYLEDCSQLRSFLCVKTHVSCVTAVKKNVYGTDKEDLGSKDLASCEAECESRRTAGQTCDAFSVKESSFLKKCYLHTSPFTSFFPATTYSNTYNLYRVTCAWAVLQEEKLMEEVTTEAVPVITTAPATTMAPVTTTAAETTTTPTSTQAVTTEASTTTTTTELATVTTTTTTETTTAEAETTAKETQATETVTTTMSNGSTTTPGTPTAETTAAENATPTVGQNGTITAPPQSQSTSATSTTTALTTTNAASATNATSSMCVCNCVHNDPVLTFNETQREISELLMEKNGTYRNRMKLVSAPDPRVSAKSIGILAVVVVVCVFGFVVLLDLPRAVEFFRGKVRMDTFELRGR